jgi:hypothetical protein
MADDEERKAGVGSLAEAEAMRLALTAKAPWHPDELRAVFEYELAAPLAVELSGLPRGIGGRVRTLSDAEGLTLKSLRDLFEHAHPPLELLRLAKDFAKASREAADSPLPWEVATALYYMSIAVALARLGERISELSPEEVKRGFDWLRAQPWVDDPTRTLLAQAMERLPAPGAP